MVTVERIVQLVYLEEQELRTLVADLSLGLGLGLMGLETLEDTAVRS